MARDSSIHQCPLNPPGRSCGENARYTHTQFIYVGCQTYRYSCALTQTDRSDSPSRLTSFTSFSADQFFLVNIWISINSTFIYEYFIKYINVEWSRKWAKSSEYIPHIPTLYNDNTKTLSTAFHPITDDIPFALYTSDPSVSLSPQGARSIKLYARVSIIQLAD